MITNFHFCNTASRLLFQFMFSKNCQRITVIALFLIFVVYYSVFFIAYFSTQESSSLRTFFIVIGIIQLSSIAFYLIMNLLFSLVITKKRIRSQYLPFLLFTMTFREKEDKIATCMCIFLTGFGISNFIAIVSPYTFILFILNYIEIGKKSQTETIVCRPVQVKDTRNQEIIVKLETKNSTLNTNHPLNSQKLIVLSRDPVQNFQK